MRILNTKSNSLLKAHGIEGGGGEGTKGRRPSFSSLDASPLL